MESGRYLRGNLVAPVGPDTMLGDAKGDALDAVLAAAAVGAAQVGCFGGVPAGVAASGEGWIYSVP